MSCMSVSRVIFTWNTLALSTVLGAVVACGGGGGSEGIPVTDLRNPLPQTQATVDEGKTVYNGKGLCAQCHGVTGKGDGPAGLPLNPPPTNFTDPTFQASRTDGQLFTTVKDGIPGTGMLSFNPSIINDTETWQVIAYIRSLDGT